MHRPARLRRSTITLIVLMSFAALACGPTGPGDDLADAPLVPADADALEAYLKQAVDVHMPMLRSMSEGDTLIPLAAAPAADSESFSTTTLQTAGVDEADLVKFDGETLFVARQPVYSHLIDPGFLATIDDLEAEEASAATSGLRDSLVSGPLPPLEFLPGEIAIYAAGDDPAEAVEIAAIELPAAASVHGMILLPGSDDGPPLLAVIGTDRVDTWAQMRLGFAAPSYYGDGFVRLWIFDVSDPSAPTALHRSKLEGSLVAVRRIGGRLVLVTRSTPYLPYAVPLAEAGSEAPAVEELDVEALLPQISQEWPVERPPRPLVRPEDCFVPKLRADTDAYSFYAPTLVTISTLSLRAPESPDSVCAAGPVDRIYSSTRSLYLAATSWGAETSTYVHKFAYTERGAAFRGSGRALGSSTSSDPDFNLGETGDVFGIMTTHRVETSDGSFDSAPRLTLFTEAGDGSRRLEERSHLPNEREPDRIGKPGEQLYAVRFVGDRVYAVTFRRIDPLYVIEIEDPSNPFIAGELEIPGFADALHPITADLLLGVGKDSIPDAGVDWFQGVKVELFDVSDPSQPTSVEAIVVGRRGSESSARTDHHAFTSLDLGDGTTRIALPISVAEGTTGAGDADDIRAWHAWSHTGLHLFEVEHDPPGLHPAGALIVAEAGDGSGWPTTWQDRSRLQGDAVHYVHEGHVWSAPWLAPEEAVGPQ